MTLWVLRAVRRSSLARWPHGGHVRGSYQALERATGLAWKDCAVPEEFRMKSAKAPGPAICPRSERLPSPQRLTDGCHGCFVLLMILRRQGFHYVTRVLTTTCCTSCELRRAGRQAPLILRRSCVPRPSDFTCEAAGAVQVVGLRSPATGPFVSLHGANSCDGVSRRRNGDATSTRAQKMDAGRPGRSLGLHHPAALFRYQLEAVARTNHGRPRQRQNEECGRLTRLFLHAGGDRAGAQLPIRVRVR